MILQLRRVACQCFQHRQSTRDQITLDGASTHRQPGIGKPKSNGMNHNAASSFMARLSVHGETVADYVRRATDSGEYCELTYRLMSDGVLLQQKSWTRYIEGWSKQVTSKSPWRVAKVAPEITANPDLLVTHHGFQKKEHYPTSLSKNIRPRSWSTVANDGTRGATW